MMVGAASPGSSIDDSRASGGWMGPVGGVLAKLFTGPKLSNGTQPLDDTGRAGSALPRWLRREIRPSIEFQTISAPR